MECQYGLFIGFNLHRNIMLSLSSLEQKGEISTYSRKGIIACAYYLSKSASAHTLK